MENVTGLVLETLDYLEKKKILRVYTKEKGKISLIMKKSKHNTLLMSPLSETEFVIHRQKGTLYSVQDATLINPRLYLRKTLSLLTHAGKFLHLILESQQEESSSPPLYTLLLSTLNHLPYSPNLPLLFHHFHLKLLKHEGLIGEHPQPPYTAEEWASLLNFINKRSYALLYQTPTPPLYLLQ